MVAKERRPARGSHVLDYQRIQNNGTITLRDASRKALGVKVGDWVVILPGSKPGEIIVRVAPHAEFEPEPPEPSK